MKKTYVAISGCPAIVVDGMMSVLGDLHGADIDYDEVPFAELRQWVGDKGQCVVIADHAVVGLADLLDFCNGRRHGVKVVVLSALAIPEELRKAADAVLSMYDSRVVLEATMRRFVAGQPEEDYPELTSREKEIIVGIVKGLSNKEIADELCVSVNTVMTHRRNIVSKLQIHSAAGLTIYAIVTHLVDLADVRIG